MKIVIIKRIVCFSYAIYVYRVKVFKLFLHNSIAIIYIILRKAIMILLREVKSKKFP